MKKLQLIFSDSEGKNQRITPVIASHSLTAEEVQEMMRRLSELIESFSQGRCDALCVSIRCEVY